ncbi:hypothetical protein TWF192_005758 [Orbilia oligospora]|uniref:Uncharacterized protein n=1 Tax=Orbilia oligospora TaxID=2813651 RepID=A0A6G1MNA0_ORBOL|nr:hypothetical protein TWF191_003882 [Orbilia oligospora]KAF3263477.1 hypothetical protein TWF192_005758 [Orbilia oligospora]
MDIQLETSAPNISYNTFWILSWGLSNNYRVMERNTEQIEESLRSNFIGTFRCSLDSINFQRSSEPVDNLKLTRIFASFNDQFLRYQDRAITAIASNTSTISQADRCDLSQRESPAPIIRTPVTCIHGRHRILAAVRFCLSRPPQQHWWYVKIYSANLSEEGQYYLANDFDFQIGDTEGEIYRRLRLAGSSDIASFLLNRFKITQRSQLATFWRHPDVTGALDSLLPFTGLWKEGFSVSKLQRICSLKCDKEVCRYLMHLRRVWSYVLLDREELFGCLDAATVSELQLRVPGFSLADANFVDNRMADMSLFPAIETQAVRQEILRRLKLVKVLIPSLSSFFHYLIFLDECANIMKLLVPRGASCMIYDSVTRQANALPNTNNIVQVSEIQFVEYGADQTDRIPDSSYKQLWLFCLRNFFDMKVAKACNRKTKSTTDPTKTSPIRWRYFASLAERLGIRVTQAIRQHGTDHAAEMALQEVMLRIRPQDIFVFTGSELARVVQHTMDYLDQLPLRQDTTLVRTPPETGFSILPIKDRFAIQPVCKTMNHFLFLRHMKDSNQTPGTDISQFFVCKDFYRSFFETDFEISFPLHSPGSPPAPAPPPATPSPPPPPPPPPESHPEGPGTQQQPRSESQDAQLPDGRNRVGNNAMAPSADASGPEDLVHDHGSPLLETSTLPQSDNEIVTPPNPIHNHSDTQIPMGETLNTQESSQREEDSYQEINHLNPVPPSPSQGQSSVVRSPVPSIYVPVMLKTSTNGEYVQQMLDEAKCRELCARYPNSRPFVFQKGKKAIAWKSVGMFYRQWNSIAHFDAF